MASPEKGEEIIVVGDEEAEMDTGGHSATNLVEVHHHVQCLDQAMQTIQAKVDAGEIKDVLKDALEEVYMAICIMMPTMKDTSTWDVLKAIRDPTCLALHKGSEEAEELLKELISGEELPSGESVASRICEEGDLTKEQQELIAELFDDLEMAYDHAARACSSLTRLSRSLSAQQLQPLVVCINEGTSCSLL